MPVVSLPVALALRSSAACLAWSPTFWATSGALVLTSSTFSCTRGSVHSLFARSAISS